MRVMSLQTQEIIEIDESMLSKVGVVVGQAVQFPGMPSVPIVSFYDHYYDYPTEDSEMPALTCRHNWKVYVGLMEMYEYCTQCNEKRKNDQVQ